MTDDPFDGIDLSSVSPQDFADLVRNAPASQLDEVMSDPGTRAMVLGEVFSRMGERYSGDRKTPAVIHWRITDKPGGGADLFETVLDGTQCTVNTEPGHEPRATISLNGPQFLKLASGNSSPTTMFFTGKVKISGDIGFAAGLANLFNIPKPQRR